MYQQVLDFGVVFRAFDQLLAGAALTLRLTFFAVVFGMAIAIVCAWAQDQRPEAGRIRS